MIPNLLFDIALCNNFINLQYNYNYHLTISEQINTFQIK